MAQLVEQCIRNAQVGGSSPPGSSRKNSATNEIAAEFQYLNYLADKKFYVFTFDIAYTANFQMPAIFSRTFKNVVRVIH